MTVKEYLDKLQKLVEEHPEYLELKVVYSKDDEGNQFKPVIYDPSAGFYQRREFNSESKEKNAICIN